MKKRLEWRGIEAGVTQVLSGEIPDFTAADIVLLGGGSDREQELVCKYLKKIKSDFKAYAEDGGVVLALCGGYQLLGNYYKTKDRLIDGLDILDIYTEWEPKRLVSDIALKSPLAKSPVVGFENHGGRTYIGNHTPLGEVLCGFGNTGNGTELQSGINSRLRLTKNSVSRTARYEGVVYKNVIGTYLHGPLLPKNPEICDYLLTKALMRRYGAAASSEIQEAGGLEIRRCNILKPLPDALEHKANSCMVRRLLQKRR